MADTDKSKADLIAQIESTGVGATSAQDIRDIVETMEQSRGGLFFSAPGTSTIGTAGVFVLAEGTTTELGSVRTTVSAAGRITYDGTPNRRGIIVGSLTLHPDSAMAKLLAVGVAINGVIQTDSVTQIHVDGDDPETMMCNWAADFTTGDYVELFVANLEDTDDIDILRGYLGLDLIFT